VKKEKSSVITPINTQIAQSGGQKLKGTVEIQHPLKILGLSYNFPHPRSLFAAKNDSKTQEFWNFLPPLGHFQKFRKNPILKKNEKFLWGAFIRGDIDPEKISEKILESRKIFKIFYHKSRAQKLCTQLALYKGLFSPFSSAEIL
jgi:hypothetical protein